MSIEIRVPPLGESLVDAVVGAWMKGEGESVNRGDVLVELETDKVNLEVAATEDGVLGKIEKQAGDVVTVGEVTFDVLHCPGHSPGSVVFAWRRDEANKDKQGFAIVGDVLFRGSVGRTDLPGGDHATLIRMIEEKLYPLGDDTAFLSGHGPMGVIGHERQTNPFL